MTYPLRLNKVSERYALTALLPSQRNRSAKIAKTVSFIGNCITKGHGGGDNRIEFHLFNLVLAFFVFVLSFCLRSVELFCEYGRLLTKVFGSVLKREHLSFRMRMLKFNPRREH